MSSFAHLHCHSHYSLLDGMCRIDGMVRRAKELGMSALALTDHGNMFGTVEFYQAAMKGGIKPIIGFEAYVAPGSRHEKTGGQGEYGALHLTLLARDMKGYHSLCQLATKAYLEGFYYKPRIDRELIEAHHEGLMCLSGCLAGQVPQLCLRGNFDGALAAAKWHRDVFGQSRYFIELQDNGLAEQQQVLPDLVKIAKRLDLRAVATSDIHYLKSENAKAHEVLLCINTGKTMDDEKRFRFASDQFHMRSPEEMARIFAAYPEAIETSGWIAEQCNCELELGVNHTPEFETPDGLTAEQYLRQICEAGLKQRYGKPKQIHIDRLNRELGVICKMGFAGYILIVWDFVRFCQENAIPCGARGSGVSTIIGYSLGISSVDPIKYGLLFERFMDPERAEMPDFDIDLCQEGRYRVIQYVRDKYGAENVAQIVTFGTMGARAVVRDVGRALSVPLATVDAIAKKVPSGPRVKLQDGLDKEPELRAMYDNDAKIKNLIDTALLLEGLARHSSTHAAGVIVGDRPLVDYCPLSKNGDDVVVQYTMRAAEKIGLLKMDFLGLRTLTVLDHARQLIEKNHGVKLDLNDLPDDPLVYRVFSEGRTKGVFQFESGGMQDLLMKMHPEKIEELIAANALYRPGPMELIPDYIERKHGRAQWEYPHKSMAKILDETFGIMAYQEQVMQILNQLGDIPLRQAYTCIKAISKKKTEIIEQAHGEFVKNAGKKGVSKRDAEDIFNLITKFGGYGFNKSHSAGYAFVAYQTAYLKTHYPREFMASLLTYESADRDKCVEYIGECKQMGIEVAPPDINESNEAFTVVGDGIRLGLAAIKGVGHKAVESIIKHRDEVGEFTDLFQFCESIDSRTVNRAVVDALIKCGAFDSLGGHRAQYAAALDSALTSGSQVQSDRDSGQMNMFAELEDESTAATLPTIEPWDDARMLADEKSVLGFYITGHPLAQHAETINRYSSARTTTLGEAPARSEVVVGGLVMTIRSRHTGRGPMKFFHLEDLHGKVECMLAGDSYERFAGSIAEDDIVFVVATVSTFREQPSLRISDIVSLADAPMRFARHVDVRLASVALPEDTLGRLHAVCREHGGNIPLHIVLKTVDGHRAVIEAGPAYRVAPSDAFLTAVATIVGPNHVRLAGPHDNGNGNGKSHGKAPEVREREATDKVAAR